MNKNLLIVGASTYATVAFEIATDMGCFEKISFVDDRRQTTPNGIAVIGTTQDLVKLAAEYSNIIVAIGNSEVRLSLISKIKKEMPYRIISLISPKAYISPSAKIMDGCIIEPMAVVHTGCLIATGCILSAGAIVNHASMCCQGVHIDCGAVVEGYCIVKSDTKVNCGDVYRRKDTVKVEDLNYDLQKWEAYLHTLTQCAPGE